MTSKKRTVCLVAGTRPEVIKLAPVFFALQRSDELQPYWLSSGQHRQMLDQAMASFGIRADVDLGLMRPSQTPAELTARAITRVGRVLSKLRPSAVIVQGDTSTALAAALAAFYQKIPIGHVEAGLRTHDMLSPWPEEMNRRLIAPLCHWNFAPTPQAVTNLTSERIPAHRCHITGNTVIDALYWMRDKVAADPEIESSRALRLGMSTSFVQTFIEQTERRWILLTLHRRESFGDGMVEICNGIRRVLERNPDCGVVCPMHLNPMARAPVKEILGSSSQIALIEPVNYSDFVWLMDKAYFIVSDSGGVQEEAPSLGKPVLVVRATTERPEGIDAGTCRLVGAEQDKIVLEAELLLQDANSYRIRSYLNNPYGDGGASEKIIKVIARDLAAYNHQVGD
ncbi:MAG: UDP-N-acetylglucosamine 2-epimerase (non-hydrolyzing) [Aeromicrobium sp.]|nr:UDP-N-acetylglucosamine 2-epimerase (non-hydrolyzing) [Burkholderiales bacterium]